MLHIEERPADARARRWLRRVLIAYSAFIALVLLWPSAGPASTTVRLTTQLLLQVGAPAGVVSGGRVELALNALMIVPIPLLASLLWPRWSWQEWTAYGFLGSLGIETVQALLLSGRSAQFPDVVSNTVGALVGSLLAPVVRRWWAHRTR